MSKPKPKARRGAISKLPEVAANQVVLIEWNDSWANNGGVWEPRDEITVQTVMDPIATVGFLVGLEVDWITVAQSIGTDQLGHVLRIPFGCILDLTVTDIAFGDTADDGNTSTFA